MGGGGGVIGAVVGAVVTVIGVVTGQPQIIAMGVTMMASSIVSAVTAPKPPNYDQNSSQLTLASGSNVQVPPATNNKLPVVYGTTFIGGTVTDLSITSDNQNLYYVLSICEVTGTQLGQADVFTFGDIFYGGKKVELSGTRVTGLTDTSTGTTDTSVDGLIHIYLYNNGSNSPANSSQSAISVMQSAGLIYTWDNTKTMTNTVFAIIQLTYNTNANVTQLAQTQFKITNSRQNTGDVFFDYLTNTVYGAAIPQAQIDSTSLNDLTTYSNQTITFNNFLGVPSTQARFKFNGSVDTTKSVMTNLQNMTQCCDCLLKYNEIYGQWAVIVQTPTTPVVMDINDSNMVSAITITTLDISNTYNIAECQFPDISLNSAFNTSTIDLSVVEPELLYPNEPQNSQTIQLPLVNNDVQAQLLATRFLKAARQDLQIQCTVNFTGLELEAGDIVTVTNANYGWVAKPFRCLRVEQNFEQDSGITVSLLLQEYDAAVYDDAAITQYQPAPNTGLPSPSIFGTVPPPVIAFTTPTGANPTVTLAITSSSTGIVQYAEVWYSIYTNPTESQRFFAGTTAVRPSGLPYEPNSSMGNVDVTGLPAGDYYFFSRMVNSLATSVFSVPSAKLTWRPYTNQYSQRYLVIAYADNITGGGFTSNPRNKAFFGLSNQSSSTPVTNPALFDWFAASPTFSTDNYLLFINYGTRKFGFSTGQADYAASTGSFVPTDAANFDRSLWSGLPDGTNFIDLDRRTGQLTETGTTTVGTGEIRVTNNSDGRVVASLAAIPALQALSGGSGTYTATVAKLTIDIYGRVLGFEPPDQFNYTMQQFSATAGQTVFTVTRASNYLINNCWVFQNGVLLDQSDFTDTAGATGIVTLDIGADIFDIITIISFRPFNTTTGTYNAFTVNYVDLVNVNHYTASGFTLVSGYEFLVLNGTVVNEQDYDIVGQTITNFPSQVTGRLAIYQWNNNNLNIPNGAPINVVTNSVIGEDTYPFSYVANALNIYQNGILLDDGTDYTAGFGDYVLANTPTDVNQILLQQTFDRTGSA
jgi:hypothetical protein